MGQFVLILGRVFSSTVVRVAAAGALLGFGWIFGEHVATKIIDRVESGPDIDDQPKPVIKLVKSE